MSSSFDTIYQKLSSLETGGEKKFDPSRQISYPVAHELNNIITIIMGYAERLSIKHAGDPSSEAHLKLIVEASRRAATIVRDATPPRDAKPPMTAGANGLPTKAAETTT